MQLTTGFSWRAQTAYLVLEQAFVSGPFRAQLVMPSGRKDTHSKRKGQMQESGAFLGVGCHGSIWASLAVTSFYLLFWAHLHESSSLAD